MAEGEDGQEKTEEPTPKKREDAREKGQIVTSKEMFVFTGMAAATLMLFLSQGFLPRVAGIWAEAFVFGGADRLDTVMAARGHASLNIVLTAGLITGLPMIVIIVATQAATGGFVFATKALGFKPDKMNPLQGFKRMFSTKSLVELGKAVLKVVLLLGAAGVVILDMLPAMGQMASLAPGDSVGLFGTTLMRVLVAMTIGLALIGAIDLGYQIYSHGQKLMMSRQEVKQESKESEGSPELKGQIRRRQMEASERAKQRAALVDVPQATAIVTNPTHFAIALRYIPGEDDAPVVLAMGRGQMAAEIRRIGQKSRVTIVGAPPLARALYYTSQIGAAISYDLYTAVAAILAHVWQLEHGEPTDLPDIDLPPELRLDENGHPEDRRT